MRQKFYLTGLLVIVISTLTFSQQRITVEEYIDMYKDLAIKSMNNYRIPASITLAQGILESNCGNSKLALEANNHFGIKCHKEWTGKTFHQDDDEKNECFRKYQKAEESFKDHSEFLTTRDRYKFLFDLDITDYKGWAHGLKKAGYATNPRYPELLIRIIEENELFLFDKTRNPIRQLADETRNPKLENQNSELKTQNPEVFEIFGMGSNDRVIFLNNGVKFILAREGDDFQTIAEEFGIYTWQIREYNELTKKDKLESGQKVYLEKKKSKSEYESHEVEPGEDMLTISQDYGIRLKALCRINGKGPGDKLSEGEKIVLK